MEKYPTVYPVNTKICITFVKRRPNVFDVVPTLYKCYANVLCLLGMLQHESVSDNISAPSLQCVYI